MKSIQNDGDDISDTELTTQCSFKKTEGGFEIVYNESEATGFKDSQTTLTFKGNSFASIVRKGDFESSLLLETGRKHFSHYGTPYGSYTIGINTIDIKNDLSESGGTAYVKYTVDMDSFYISENEIYFSVN